MKKGHIPLGYKVNHGKAVIDPKEGEAVKALFTDYLQGQTLDELAKALIEKEVLNANGEIKWNHSSIGRILENIKYAKDDFFPKLIDLDVYDRVQKERRKRAKVHKHDQRRSGKEELFYHTIVCKECQGTYKKYIGKYEKSKCWVCTSYRSGHKKPCATLKITEEQLSELCNKLLMELYKNPECIKPEPKQQIKKSEKESMILSRYIEKCMQSEEVSAKEVKSLLFRRAAAIYKINGENSQDFYTEKIKQILQKNERSWEENAEEIVKKIIKCAYADLKGQLEFELINGQMVVVSI